MIGNFQDWHRSANHMTFPVVAVQLMLFLVYLRFCSALLRCVLFRFVLFALSLIL